MPQISHKFVVVALTQDEARIWSTGVAPGTKPEKIVAPDAHREHHHVRQAQAHGGHSRNGNEVVYFEAIAKSVADAGEILLLGHGKGKANAMLNFIQFLERKHPSVATKVAGAVDSNLQALTEPEVLAEARHWFETHQRPGEPL